LRDIATADELIMENQFVIKDHGDVLIAPRLVNIDGHNIALAHSLEAACWISAGELLQTRIAVTYGETPLLQT
jgi:hypothetical protein